jgi:hypothetical protein
MSKAARGKKRVCKKCGAKFYDLGKEEIPCPMCGVMFVVAKNDGEGPLKTSKKKKAPKVPAPEEAPEDIIEEDDDLDVLDDDAEIDDSKLLDQDDDEGPNVEDVLGDIPKDDDEH